MKIIELQKYGASEELIKTLLSFNLSELYPPQEEAVKKGIFRNDDSFVISSPTASGKTFIAEMAILKTLLEKKGKVIYLVPLKALAMEKYEEFSIKYNPLGFIINQSTSDFDSVDSWLEKSDVIISTNEKMDSLIRHRVPWIMDVGLVVADEVHLIGDPYRGPTLEIVLVRLKYLNPKIRFIALSATIPNATEIANWMNATLVQSNWRPVPLKEGVYFSGTISYKDGSLQWTKERSKTDLINLAIDTAVNGGQALIFVNTRKSTETVANKLVSEIDQLLSDNEKESLKKISNEILTTLPEPTRVCKKLAKCIEHGVSFHHAGLHSKQRKLIEDNFRKNIIKILTSTTTLAMGLNLPSRRVIIRDWKRYESGFGMKPIPVIEMKQMFGRAGRPQFDDYGEAIILVRDKKEEKFIFENYLLGKPELIFSQLGCESALRTHVLSSIAGLFVMNEDDLINFMKNTFYAYQSRIEDLSFVLKNILSFLMVEGMIEKFVRSESKNSNNFLKATKFGDRISQLYIDPLSAVILRDSLIKAEEKNISSPIFFLHLISSLPDMISLTLKKKDLFEIQLQFNKFKEELLINSNFPSNEILSQIKTALVLLGWIEENSEDMITEKFEIGPGDLYSMIERADWLLYSSTEISKIFKLKNITQKLELLRKRVIYGIKEELIPLVYLEGIGRVRGRNLYKAGYRTHKDLMLAKTDELAKVPSIGKVIAESIKKQIMKIKSI